MRTADVIVIGAGINGTSTAFHLARAGVKNVVVVERGYLGSGSTGKSGALVRTNYANAAETQLAVESLPYFKQWEELVGGSCTHDPRNIWEVNVLGTRHALDAAVRGGVQRFLHISSVVAYSFDFPPDVTENYPVRCNGVPYVDSKVMGEQVVLQAHAAGEIDSMIVRPGDVYGPGSRPWTTRPVRLIKAGSLILPLQGKGIFTPIYIDNLVDKRDECSVCKYPIIGYQITFVNDYNSFKLWYIDNVHHCPYNRD